jgi:hypothetical protein
MGHPTKHTVTLSKELTHPRSLFLAMIIILSVGLARAEGPLFQGQGPTTTTAARDLTGLTSAEMRIVSQICERVLLDYFPARPALMYTQVLHALPKSEERPLETGRELNPPIELPTINIPRDVQRQSVIRQALKQKISNIGLRVQGNRRRLYPWPQR